MKKTIVASAITLSVLGLTSPAFAEDSKIVETTIRDKATEVKEKIELPSSEEQTTTTNTPPASKPKEEAKVSETKKDGWIQEDNQWRFYEIINPSPNGNKSKVNGTTSTKMVTALATLPLMAMHLTMMVLWLVEVGLS